MTQTPPPPKTLSTLLAKVPPSVEFHRYGVGLLPDPQDSRPGVAVYVERPSDRRKPLRMCSCPRKRNCQHLERLARFVEKTHTVWGHGGWEEAAASTLWCRLTKLLYEGQAQPAESARLRQTRRNGHRTTVLLSSEGAPLLRYLEAGPQSARLVERCGLSEQTGDGTDRVQLLRRLRLLQVTPEEELINNAGLLTRRQAAETSFWQRFGYHALREYGDTAGTFHPSVDRRTGTFQLTYHTRDDTPLLRLHVPPGRVEVVLALLANEFPQQPDLAVHPVPLRSLFCVSEQTRLDLDVRPQIRALQAWNETRFLARPDVHGFRYGRLVYLSDMELLTEIETPGHERRFAAPVAMELRRSHVPLGLEQPEDPDDDVTVDAPQPPQVYRDFDSIQVRPEALDRSWYWLSVHYGFGSDTVSLADILRAKKERLPTLETANGWIDLNAPAFADLGTLEALDQPGLRKGDQVRLSPRELLRVRWGSNRPFLVQGEAKETTLLNRLFALQPARSLPQPDGLISPLRAYQQLGLDWLRFLYENGLAGLLCDEMGLGKTHQAMALFVSLVEQLEVRAPFLVVCPTSVVSHWRDKLQRHAPGLDVLLYHGAGRDLAVQQGTVVVTSYGVLRNDFEKLGQVDFAVAVFDEVQQIKNKDTRSYRAALAVQAHMRLGLSGTPIENDLKDLKALLDLMLPGHLGSDRAFSRRYGSVAFGGRPRALDELQRLIAPFVLRRLKSAVLDELPDKIEDTRTCALSDDQVRLYRQAVSAKADGLVAALRQDGRRVPYIHVFALLTLLKQICDHPALVAGSAEDQRRLTSGKWELFEEILQESLESGQKVVVFSQFLGMIEIMKRHLVERGVGFVSLTGASRDRGEIVRRFNNDADCRVFLGSLRAGGAGIDLVAGSVVIHYDRWWNAAKEDQATDRVHRIGQKRAVQVFRLVTEGTLEEKIAAIIERKRGLLDNVVQADEPHLAKLFSRQELIDLLSPV